MNISITLTEKQERAFLKRVSEGSTPEELAATIVTDTAQQWAASDYHALSSEIIAKLADKPQAVLDGIVAQLSSI